MRALVSFTAFFGLAGVLGGWLDLGSTAQLLTALVTGLLAGAVTAYTFRLAQRHGNVSFETATLVGRVGQVTVPLRHSAARLTHLASHLGARLDRQAVCSGHRPRASPLLLPTPCCTFRHRAALSGCTPKLCFRFVIRIFFGSIRTAVPRL